MSGKLFGTPDVDAAVDRVCAEVRHVLDQAERERIARFVKAVESARRIYITGMGRSGLAGQAFAVRLVHLGFDTHVVGEVTATAIGPGDLLVAISGSGATRTVVAQCEAAISAGSLLAGITAAAGSIIDALASGSAGTVLLPCCLGVRHRAEGLVETRQYGGSLFEQAVFLLLDSLVQVLAAHKGRTDQDMKSRHANLE